MKKLIPLTIACAAFLFASCGGGNSNQGNTTGSESSTETSTEATAPAEETTAANEDQASNTIELTGNDQMKYNKTEFTVKAGEPITLTLKNIGELPAAAMSHDAVILKPGSDVTAFGQAATQAREIEKMSDDLKDEIIAQTKMLGPGEEDEITFTLDEPGEYPFLCTFPGHYATMQGTITAE